MSIKWLSTYDPRHSEIPTDPVQIFLIILGFGIFLPILYGFIVIFFFKIVLFAKNSWTEAMDSIHILAIELEEEDK